MPVSCPACGIADSTLAPPAVRYLAEKSDQGSCLVLLSSPLPKEIVADVTSRSMEAEPLKSGPCTWTVAPRWNDRSTLIVPNQPRSTLIETPAAMEAYPVASKENGSKYTIASMPRISDAHRNPRSSDAVNRVPAMIASLVIAK